MGWRLGWDGPQSEWPNSVCPVLSGGEVGMRTLFSTGGSGGGAAVAEGETLEHSGRGVKAPVPRKRRSSGSFGTAAPYLTFALLVMLLVVLYFWSGIVVVIHSGEAGALYRLFLGGTVTDYVYPEGIHIVWPWNRMYIYNVRVQTVMHEFSVLTNKGLPIRLKLAIRYHPEYEMVAILHKRVGPDYVNTIVVPQIESVLRRNIGKHDPEDIYTNKEGILTDIIVKAIEEAGQKFVFIDDIIIRTVDLPDDVKHAIEEKLVHQQRFQAYEFRLAAERQEAERKRIEAQGIRDYQATIAETLTDKILKWQGIHATEEIANSNNAKVVVVGNGDKGLPIILGGQ
ncbi:MAG: prohibitin family protein [Azospirillum sp.]|nr:prohibitin family protein [Azospirillum sp.]